MSRKWTSGERNNGIPFERSRNPTSLMLNPEIVDIFHGPGETAIGRKFAPKRFFR